MGNLYTYVPKHNTLDTVGLYGPKGDTEENLARRYGSRAGSTNKQRILDWLDSTLPGRSNGVCVITEPIPDTASQTLRDFRDSNTLVQLPDAAVLIAAGVIGSTMYRTAGNKRWDPVTEIKEKPIHWERTRNNVRAFKSVPHYMLMPTGATIPSEFLQKEAAMSAEERLLRRLARPYYPAVGKRSWEHVHHVSQLLRNTEMMTQGLEHRPLTLQEKAAIYFHDCALKARGTGKQHGRYGKELALPLLLATGFFNDKPL